MRSTKGSAALTIEVVIQHRPTEKITAKQVWLAETRLYPARRLPRHELELGEVWRDYKTYGFGCHLRNRLQQKLDAARSHQIDAQEDVEFLRSQRLSEGSCCQNRSSLKLSKSW